MIWQWVVVAGLVSLAVAYLARAAWRTWSVGQGGCAKGCGCAGAAPPAGTSVTLISSDQLQARLRTVRRP